MNVFQIEEHVIAKFWDCYEPRSFALNSELRVGVREFDNWCDQDVRATFISHDVASLGNHAPTMGTVEFYACDAHLPKCEDLPLP